MAVRKRLDWDALRSAGVPLRIVATDAQRGTAVGIADFESRDELMEALRASARLPLLAGPPLSLRAPAGRRRRGPAGASRCGAGCGMQPSVGVAHPVAGSACRAAGL